MRKEQFYEITSYIGSLIEGTEFEHKVYAVGGSVRDLIMGNDIKDIDLVVEMPDGGVKFANWLDEKGLTHANCIYPTYGTAKFCLNEYPDEEIEAVMTRGEKYTDPNSRNPVCSYDNIQSDAIRRDLTINAIYYNVSTGEIYDPTGGEDDIKNQRPVKVTNDNPDVIMEDDPLRICRVIRFASRFNLPIEEKTYASMKKHVDRLEIISKERIRDEFCKIITDKHAERGIKMLIRIGAMKYIIPELVETVGLEQNKYHFGDVFEHTMMLLHYYHNQMRGSKGKADLTTVLALLLHDIGKIKTKTIKDGKIHFYDHEFVGAGMVEPILRNLKFDNDTINEVKFLVKNHMRTKNFSDDMVKIKPKSFNKLAYECGCKERWLRLATVIECDNMSHKLEHNIRGQFNTMFASLPKASKMFGYKLPITGEDIMSELNISPGRDVKLVLDKMLKRAFVNPEITKESCIKQLKHIYKEVVNEKTKEN